MVENSGRCTVFTDACMQKLELLCHLKTTTVLLENSPAFSILPLLAPPSAGPIDVTFPCHSFWHSSRSQSHRSHISYFLILPTCPDQVSSSCYCNSWSCQHAAAWLMLWSFQSTNPYRQSPRDDLWDLCHLKESWRFPSSASYSVFCRPFHLNTTASVPSWKQAT